MSHIQEQQHCESTDPSLASIYQSENSINALIDSYQEDTATSLMLENLKKHYNLSTSTVHFCQQLISFVDRICNLLTPKDCGIGCMVSLFDTYCKSFLEAFYKKNLTNQHYLLMIQDITFVGKRILPYVYQKLTHSFGINMEEVDKLSLRMKGLRDTVINLYCERTSSQFFSDACLASMKISYDIND